jgi:hypothetical protein
MNKKNLILNIIAVVLILVVTTHIKLYASNQQQLNKKKWEALTKDLNYQDDTKKEVTPKNGYNKKSTINFPTININYTGQIVLIIIVVMVLIFISKLIIKIKPNSTFENLTNIVEKIEDKLLESDIEMLLQNAKKLEACHSYLLFNDAKKFASIQLYKLAKGKNKCSVQIRAKKLDFIIRLE